jgi:hypothetical protein
VSRHIRDARRAIEFQRSGPAFHGGSEIKIGQAGSVVRMQVRGKYDPEIFWRERGNGLVSGGSGGATYHAGTKVNEISGAIHHDGDRWSRAIRIDDGRAGAEDDELGVSVLGECNRCAEKEGCGEFERTEFHEAERV